MNCSTPGLPVHHQLPEYTQTHVHRVSDAIQPPHHLLSPFPLPSIFPTIRVFSDESALRIRWPKHWNFSFSPSNIQGFVPMCKTAVLPCKPRVHPAASTAVSGGGLGHIGSFMQVGPVSSLSSPSPHSSPCQVPPSPQQTH